MMPPVFVPEQPRAERDEQPRPAGAEHPEQAGKHAHDRERQHEQNQDRDKQQPHLSGSLTARRQRELGGNQPVGPRLGQFRRP